MQPGEAQAPPVVDAILFVMDCLFSALELESRIVNVHDDDVNNNYCHFWRERDGLHKAYSPTKTDVRPKILSQWRKRRKAKIGREDPEFRK